LDAVLTGILDHRNIVVCGATRSGKTTFLNAILAAVADLCPNERLVVVEDTLEVKSSVRNTETLRTSQHKDHHDLLKATLRLSPDRIVFGEVRDKAVLALLDAWTTDHSGFATFHAADAEGALRRMNRLAMRNRVPPQLELVAEAVHVLVLIQGGSVKRHVREVVRVSGFDPRERRFSFQRLA
jgi:Flp pilus assembly CpaF family ATPase